MVRTWGTAAASCLSEIVSRRPLPLKPFGFFERVIYLCLLQRFKLCLSRAWLSHKQILVLISQHILLYFAHCVAGQFFQYKTFFWNFEIR